MARRRSINSYRKKAPKVINGSNRAPTRCTTTAAILSSSLIKVYNRAGATTYPVVDIEPPYVNAPHYKGQQNQELRERNYATFIRGGAGINFGHEKWWPFGVTGLFDGGPDWLNDHHRTAATMCQIRLDTSRYLCPRQFLDA